MLAWTAAKMIVGEPFLATYFANPIVKYGFELLVIAGVLMAGKWKNGKMHKEATEEAKAANG